MDPQNESIRPRRGLHNRAWQFAAFCNPNLTPRQMAVVHPTNLPQLSSIPPDNEHLYSGVNSATYKVPILLQPDEKMHDQSVKKCEIGKEKKPSILKKALLYLEEYCDSSTLHGLKYVGDSTLSLLERLYWLAMFTGGLCFAAYFIAQIYAKFETSPMVISFNPKLVFLNTFPFPAITICNVNLALKSKADEIERNGDETSKALLGDLCNTQHGTHSETKQTTNTTNWDTVEKFIIDVNQKCDELVKVCKWSGKRTSCNKLINSVLTDEGYCCAFNQLPINMILRGNFKNIGYFPPNIINWNDEEGYGNEENASTFPYRAAGQGQSLGLTLVLDAQLAEYHCTSTNSIGFKLLFSAPNERPKIAEVGFLLSPGIETRIAIRPDIADATEGVKGIPVEKRQCFFAQERCLEFFYVYSEKNCRLECQSNYTMQLCGCVPYYLPRDPIDPICDREKEDCISEAKSVIERFTPERQECRCLPACHDISYGVDTMSVAKLEYKYDTVNSDLLGNITPKYFSENMAIAHFYFDTDKFVKSTKSEMFGFSEFLSNTGGLLGLFLGFSFLSAMEIVYFIFFRLQFRYFRRYKASKLTTKQEKEDQKRWAQLPYIR